MRRLLLTTAAVAALVGPATAHAATKTVTIKSGAFDPGTVTIRTGDRITWKNSDSKSHQVVSNTGAFASPILAAGKTWSFMFARTGTYRYHDGLHANVRGAVVVRARPAPPAAVSLTATTTVVVFGQTTRLTGSVSSGKANETVEIFARSVGQASFVQVGTVLTGAGGAWGYDVKPGIQTNYQARFRSAVSGELPVYVRPRVRLIGSRKFLYASVRAAGSFAGHYIILQRRTLGGFWAGVARFKLGASSGKLIRIPRRHGVSVYRVYLTQRQAGTGYLDSWSGTQTVRRR
jgi:plastocyanin